MGGSSGSAGGGGASGAVSHSAYLEAIHQDWLNATGVDIIEKSITEVMDTALGNSPYIGQTAYDPDTDIAAYETELALFKALIGGLSDTADWATLYAQADLTLSGAAEAAIIADAVAFEAILDADIIISTLPRFRRGMQDINAVQSSAFVLGEAVIEGFRDREVAKHTSILRLDVNARKLTAVEHMMQLMGRRIAWNESYSRTMIEASRIKLVAKKEESDRNLLIDATDAKWDLEVFQYGANLLASIGGGTAIPYSPGTNPTASTLGGVLAVAGAAATIYSAVK
jgi:hypothetical protein